MLPRHTPIDGLQGLQDKKNSSPDSDFEFIKHSTIQSDFRPVSVRTHYETRAIKSILSASRFVPKEGGFIVKPKEMKLVSASPEEKCGGRQSKLVLPLDELEEEEHRKYAAAKNWAFELEKASPIKSIVGKTVSFNIEPENPLELGIKKRPAKRAMGSPKSKDAKTTKNSDVVVNTRRSPDPPPGKSQAEKTMLSVAEESDEEILQEGTKKLMSLGFDLDD